MPEGDEPVANPPAEEQNNEEPAPAAEEKKDDAPKEEDKSPKFKAPNPFESVEGSEDPISIDD